MRHYKVLITTGGTGGHIFPAEALASQLEGKEIDVLFVGGGLGNNKYFKKERYQHLTVDSSSPFRGNIFKAWWKILKGIYQSLKIITQSGPNLVVGFGSFYSFPVLVAAKLKKIPIILFEPNARPGKVNRLFSRWAILSTLQFKEAAIFMKGKCVEVKMQVTAKITTPEKARDYFYLDPHKFTFLVFGGSQGAESINELFSQAVTSVDLDFDKFQVIHIAGNIESADRVRNWYTQQGVSCCVKAFEEQMEKAWSAADYVICRSGAWTVAEQIASEVPALFIPFPKATENHQAVNARIIQERGGAVMCEESQLGVEKMRHLIKENITKERLTAMRQSLDLCKQREKQELSDIITHYLGNL